MYTAERIVYCLCRIVQSAVREGTITRVLPDTRALISPRFQARRFAGWTLAANQNGLRAPGLCCALQPRVRQFCFPHESNGPKPMTTEFLRVPQCVSPRSALWLAPIRLTSFVFRRPLASCEPTVRKSPCLLLAFCPARPPSVLRVSFAPARATDCPLRSPRRFLPPAFSSLSLHAPSPHSLRQSCIPIPLNSRVVQEMAAPNGHVPASDARPFQIEAARPSQEQRQQHATPSAPLLPPPRPSRLHSYHHPISASYTSGNSFLDRHRHPPPPSWEKQEHRSPPLEHRPSEPSSFSRILPPLSGSGYNSFALPSIASNLPSSASWNGLDSGRDYNPPGSYRTTDARYSTNQDHKLPSLSVQYAQYTRPSDNGVLGSPTSDGSSSAGRKSVKAHVPSACLNCKRAHLACDVGRPCRRCVNLGKSDTCVDVQHKKRGRPRLKDRPTSQSGATPARSMELTASPSSESGHFRSPGRSSEMPFVPQASADSVVQVAGMTHGSAVHHRHASVSVSASSYPFSRPDHLRYPSDRWSKGQQRSPNLHSHSRLGDSTVSAVVTVICSTDLRCARVSEECVALLDFHPTEMMDRSLFELVHPSDSARLERIWTSLIDPVGVVPQTAPVSADRMMTTPPARLMAPASGTIFVQEDVRLRQRSGMFDFYSVRLHLGGGFGVDLYKRDTLDRAYIVASLLKLGNDADHPDPAELRTPYSQGEHNREFRTPTSKRSVSPAKSDTWSAARPQADYASQRNDRSDHHEQLPGITGSRDLHSSGSSNGAHSSKTDHETVTSESSRQPSSKQEDNDRDDESRAHQREDIGRSPAHQYSSKSSMFPPPPAARSLLSERSSASGRDVILC